MSLDDLTQTSRDSSGTDSRIKPKRSLAWLLPVGLLLGFLLILGLLFGERLVPATEVSTAPVITIRADQSASSTGQPATVSPDKSQGGRGQLLFQASGWVEPDPYTTYVPTLVNGVVRDVHALEGQSVKKGDLVATLIDDDAKLDLQSATQQYKSLEKKIVAHCTGLDIVQAEITAAKRKEEALETQLDEATDAYSRLKGLSKGAVSQQQVVQARLASERQIAMLAEARAELPQLRAKLDQIEAEREAMMASLEELATQSERAKLALDRTRISAPIDGVVLRLHAAPGKKRMLDMDDPKSAVIVELYDPERLQARIDVPLNEAAALSPGQSVELLSDLLPNQTFTGTVSRISGQADLQRNTLQAKVTIENPDSRLRPDMLMRAKFFALSDQAEGSAMGSSQGQSSSGRLAIYAPEQAIIGEDAIWVVASGDTAERRAITLGQDSRDGHRLVLEGLRSGESVILPPHGDLQEGSRIKTTNTH